VAEHLHGHRVLTPEYIEQRPPARPIMLHSNDNYTRIPSTNGNMLNPMVVPSTSSYEGHYRPSSQPLPSFESYEPAWPVSMYEPVPPVNISSWSVPQWMPSIEYTPPMTSRTDAYQFTPPHSHHSYDDLSTPPQQSRTPDPELYFMGHGGRRDHYFSNASLPSSTATSPFCHTRYHGGH
jgi:hypothetical protein